MLRTRVESLLNAMWYAGRHHWLSVALAPVESLYTVLAKRRWRQYAAQRTESLAVPVVTIGNIVAGGSGKTPVTQALAIELRSRGIKVGIVSRGYGGTVRAATQVLADQTQRFGDEACLLALTTDCPVVVARVRSQAVQMLHEQHHVDLVLSDDGMQHAALHRDFEICVIGARVFGNGRGLPAGPMREPVTRLGKVEAVLTWGARSDFVPVDVPQWQIAGVHSPLQLLSGATAPEGTLQALALQQHTNKKIVVAAAGIAQPDRFYRSLAGAGLKFSTLFVSDHGMLSAEQWRSVPAHALLLVTEKDAIKLRHAQLPARLQRMVRTVPWRVSLPPALVNSVAALLPATFEHHSYES